MLELVADRGVDGVTIDAIASAAQASKQTLLSRWATKDGPRPTRATSGRGGRNCGSSSTRRLRCCTRATRLIIAVVDGAQRDPNIMRMMRAETRDALRRMLQMPFKRAIARGEISPRDRPQPGPDIALPLLLHRAMWATPSMSASSPRSSTTC